ncbi:type II toxin-antitoxin system VapC family toxin [Candidatus Bathyarchaeota archaeon]|nr:type II toxin-antitoxin system VapC family toxin [Candidatus Bathyarchaeota archaeon]
MRSLASAFIDSNIFVAFANKRDRDHVESVELMNRLRKGEFGQPYTSDYVFDEAVTTGLVRTGRIDTAVKMGKIILGSKEESIPSMVRLIRVDEEIFGEAWAMFKTGRFEGLSFTDHTILAQLKEFKIDVLISFDKGFDGLAARIP